MEVKENNEVTEVKETVEGAKPKKAKAKSTKPKAPKAPKAAKVAKPKAARGKKALAKEPVSQMFQGLDRALEQVAKDKGIPRDKLIEAIEQAFLTAARKKWGHLGELESHYNDETGEIELFQFKSVSDNVVDPAIEMTVEEAHELDPDAEVGDSLGVKMDPSVFGRIAAQTAKQVIIQKMRDAERDIVYEEFKDRLGELITGIVRRFEKGDLIVDLGRTEALVPRSEQIPSEHYKIGERLQGYFMSLNREKGSQVVLSRKHPMFVQRLFEMEVPEVSEGIVEIKGCAREAGIRTKIAVYSRDSDVDPVGACVGMRGSRVQSVVQELKGEKIDIVSWDNDPARFVCNAIAPAEVVKVVIKEKEHAMEVVVPDDQLSLAIGKKGQNVRLAAQLTGWSIDVFSETKVEELATRHKMALVRALGIDDGTSLVLYSHTYRTLEEIAETPLEEFQDLPGLSKDMLADVHAKACAAKNSGIATAALIAEIVQEQEAEKAAMAATFGPGNAEEVSEPTVQEDIVPEKEEDKQ